LTATQETRETEEAAMSEAVLSAPVVALTAEEVAEIESAVVATTRAQLPLLSVRRRDFPLPTGASTFARIAQSVEEAPGFCLVRALPVQRYSESGVRRLYWGIGRHLGVAVPQDATGHLLQPAQTSTPRFRSGGSDLISLLALEEGRTVSLVSAGALFDEVKAQRPDLARRMFDSFAVDRCGEQMPGELPFRSVPLACWSDGRLSLRYDRRAIESAQQYADAPRLSRADIDLLDLIDDLASSPEMCHDVHLRTGDLLLVNSYDVLYRHSGSGPGPDGRLLRMWLTLRGGRRLPADFTWPTPAYGDVGGRGGVTPLDVIDRSARRSGDLALH
jgi:hypothetical protein